MAKLFQFVILFLLVIPHISAQQTDTLKPRLDTIIIPNNAFQIGEKLVYSAKYGIIEGGRAYLSVNVIPHGYTYVYHAKAYAETVGITDKFATIRDIYESYFDIESGLPIMAVRNIQENNYLQYDEVRFDRQNNIALSLRNGLHQVPADVMDVLSAFYFARTYLFKNLTKNQVIVIQTYFEDGLFPVEMKFKGYENVKTRFGKIKCLTFGPIIREKSPFAKEEDLRIWFSDDGNYLPVKVHVKIPVGSVKLELIQYEGLKYDLKIEK